jgi:hypothetical protein
MTARDGSGVHARYDRFVRAMQARFPNLTVLDARYSGYLPAVFVDATHLDRDGAVRLSADVAEVLREASHRPGADPRWVKLPDYRERPVAISRMLEDVNQSRAIQRRNDERLRR